MDGSSNNAPPPFLSKTYEMVDDLSTDAIVSWSRTGLSFIVWNPPDFARDLLPKYFKHNNFSSFVRQLNTYGFRKMDPDQWEFGNEEFIRGQKDLLKKIYRRKPIHSHSLQNQVNTSASLSDSERQEFVDEIARLKHENSMLRINLQCRTQGSLEFEVHVKSLVERLQTIELRQRKMMSFLSQILQDPRFSSEQIHWSEVNYRKRRLLMSTFLDTEANKTDSFSSPVPKFELVEKLESSLIFWESFLCGVGPLLGEEETYDFGVLSKSEPVVIAELQESSEDSDSPADGNSGLYLKLDVRAKSSGIDVNTRPGNVSVGDEGAGPSGVLESGANDVFWEQFLTESPGGSGAQEVEVEVESERREVNNKLWWKVNNKRRSSNRNNSCDVDNLTEQMGQLSPAAKI
jgi:heat shock transcription factor